MEPNFRASMSWLHTWAGLVLGSVLFAMFWMGSLSVFDHEIDRWMAPMTRLPLVERPTSLDALRPSLANAAAAKSPYLFITLPADRQPVLQISYSDGPADITRSYDPATGAELADPGTLAGTGFLFRFHYMLHIRVADFGIWIVGFAGMAMLVLCISGVVIHRKIFTDFFTFRPDKKFRRALLDLHTVAGVLGLPFHFMITLSGLIIFATSYFPSGWQAAYKDSQAYYADISGNFVRDRGGSHASRAASLDSMAADARLLSGGEPPSYIRISYPGDTASYVVITSFARDRVTRSAYSATFDAASGGLLQNSSPAKPVMAAQDFLSGMHRIDFRNWPLRWLYFVMGLSGCVLIATGYLFWLDSRRKKHAQLGLAGASIVEGLAIGSVTGIIIATIAFFVANRLLPLGVSAFGQARAVLEVWAFYGVWLATFVHGWIRRTRAWIEQCWAISGLSVTAALLNWITTGDHLIRSLTHRYLWPIAGMDLLLIVGAYVAALAALRIGRAAAPSSLHVRRAEYVTRAIE